MIYPFSSGICNEDEKGSNLLSIFSFSPTPNPLLSRTPKFIFLETAVFPDGREQVRDLYTPFGLVHLISGGDRNKMLQISKEFLEEMNWEIENVTPSVSYMQEGRPARFPVKKETWLGSGMGTRVYLVKRVDSIEFVTGALNEELVVFPAFSSVGGQYENDKAQFRELSEGKNCF